MRRFGLAVSLSFVVACANGPSAQHDAGPSDAPRVDAGPSGSGNGCPIQPCTILPQCGCGAGACDVATPSGTSCRDITQPGIEINTCDTTSACAAGYTCFGRDKASATCKKFCTSNADCGTPRGRCALTVGSGTGVPEACSSNCSPTDTTPTECPSTFKCGLFTVTSNGTSTQIANCTPAGTQTQGTDCKVGTAGDDTLCAKGYRCSTLGGGVYQCRKYCKVSAPACAANQTCVPFIPKYIVDVEYGICN